jgi:hypothetical protein
MMLDDKSSRRAIGDPGGLRGFAPLAGVGRT